MLVNIGPILDSNPPDDYKLPALLEPVRSKAKVLYKAGHELSVDDLQELKQKRFNRINVTYNHDFFRFLNKVEPTVFIKPVKSTRLKDIVKEAKFLDFANANSGKKRRIISCMELYDEKGKVLVEYGHELSVKFMESIAPTQPENTYLAYRYSEYKIIVLVNLKPLGDDFVRRFQLNADIAYILIKEIRNNPLVNIISKLEVKKDILIVDDPTLLDETYRQHDVRLIIIGDAVSLDYRQALVQVKKYDPYARFMLANKINPNNVGKFLFDVELNYSRDNWL